MTAGKTISLLCALLLIIGTGSAQTLKRRVAIGPFAVSATPAVDTREADQAGRMAMGLLAARLKAAGGLVVVDKSNYRDLSAACDSVKCDIPLVATGAEYMMIGTIVRLEQGDTLSHSRLKPHTAEALVALRMVDVPSGATIYSGRAHGQSSTDKGVVTELRKVAGKVAGKVMGVEAPLAEEAIGNALSTLVGNALAKCMALPWTAYILSYDSGSFVLSCGTAQGVKQGDHFAVYEFPQRGPKGPARRTGHSMGTMEIMMTISSRGPAHDAVSVGQMVDGKIDTAALGHYYLAQIK